MPGQGLLLPPWCLLLSCPAPLSCWSCLVLVTAAVQAQPVNPASGWHRWLAQVVLALPAPCRLLLALVLRLLALLAVCLLLLALVLMLMALAAA